MQEYNHKKIEQKWQEKWMQDELYKAEIDNDREKEYLLVEFPYPSGDGLHVGHVRSYTAMDVIARKHRMEGKNVLYPMGWDAFGLPTENFAVKTGIHPKTVTKQNTDTFRAQLQSLGLSFDWSREINTTDPEYYKWTQWIFLQLFKEGLAYKKNMPINWCLDCKIGLANEEVVDGQCERCGGDTEKRDKEQWMLAITKYADRLVDDLDEVDYWDRIKTQQKNWIGRSEGAEIEFPISNSQLQANSNTQAQNTKSNVVLVRGCTESPDDKNTHWLPWVEEKLTKAGIKAKKAEMLTPWDPRYEEWKEEFEKSDINENSILVGHSCGCAFLVRWLGETKQYVKKLILVAPWKTSAGSEGEKELYDFEIDSSVKERVSEIVMFTSNNEEKEGKESLEIYKDALGGRVIELENKGHYVEEDMGTVEFPELLNEIRDTKYNILNTIPVFTTRPDTLFGATYLVLSPEHKEITKIQDTITNRSEVETYIKEAKKKTEMDRTAEDKEKTGVKLEGISAVNPATKEEIPVFVADYVLAHYGTGAIMAVPAHDERDFAFAQKYDIPVREVIMPTVTDTVNAPRDDKPTKERHNVHAIVYSPKRNAYLALHSKEHDWKTVVIGGVEEGEDVVEAARREVREETGYTDLTFECHLGGPVQAGYFAKHKDENRKSITQALYFTLDSEKQVEREDDDGEVIWVAPEDFKQGYMINSELPFWLERLPHEGACVYTGNGVLVNSNQFDGMDSDEAKRRITEFVGGEMKTTYKLRDWVFSRQRYWGEPIPLVFCEHCAERIKNNESGIGNGFNAGELRNPGWIMDENLPVELPEVEDFMPTESGDSPLAKAVEWVKTTCPKCGGEATRETDVMPNWAGSSWYYLRYTDANNDSAFARQDTLAYWTPVDWYNGGMEHTTLHLLYSRFWHKFLFDQGLVPTKEPYMKRTSHGMILAEGGVKMSKSKGNTINPNEVVERVGADTLRMYEMFMGPFDQAIAWNTDAMVGVRKFLERVWRLQNNLQPTTNNPQQATSNDQQEPVLHKTIKKVSEDIDQLKFNTAVSQMMTLVNTVERQKVLQVRDYELLITILAPFAPHLTEELWHQLGYNDSVHLQHWPEYDPEKIKESEMTIAVQVNGKVRDSFTMPAEATEEEVKQEAQERDAVQKWLADAEIERVIYVPGKLVNIVKARE